MELRHAFLTVGNHALGISRNHCLNCAIDIGFVIPIPAFEFLTRNVPGHLRYRDESPRGIISGTRCDVLTETKSRDNYAGSRNVIGILEKQNDDVLRRLQRWRTHAKVSFIDVLDSNDVHVAIRVRFEMKHFDQATLDHRLVDHQNGRIIYSLLNCNGLSTSNPLAKRVFYQR